MRKHLVWVLALALAIGIASIAVGANSQTVDAKLGTTKLPKTKYKGTSINVTTTTNDTDGNVDPATKAQIFFDDDLQFFTRGIPICDPADLTNTTTAQAKKVCGKAQVGAGSATVALAGNPEAPANAVITAFNGKPQGGKPVILLHSRTAPPINNTIVLIGVLKSTSGDFGKVLEVAVPALPANTAITRFQTKVQKSFRFRGKRRSYVSARCNDSNKTINYKGVFTYSGGSPTKTALDNQKCTVQG